MELKQGKITFLFDHDGASLEIEDDKACIKFVKVRLNNKQVCQMLSRLASIHCEKVEVFNLEKVGKKHINKTFEFELPTCDWHDRKEIALQQIKYVCPKGWKSDNYFNSQDSFFTKDDKLYARVTIRQWR